MLVLEITIDVEHDSVDKEAGKRIECPMLLLLAKVARLTLSTERRGPREFGGNGLARARTGDERRTLFPEENPDDMAALIKQFLAA